MDRDRFVLLQGLLKDSRPQSGNRRPGLVSDLFRIAPLVRPANLSGSGLIPTPTEVPAALQSVSHPGDGVEEGALTDAAGLH